MQGLKERDCTYTYSPTEMCRELPSTAYTNGGTKEEYSPKTTGSRASRANPMAA